MEIKRQVTIHQNMKEKIHQLPYLTRICLLSITLFSWFAISLIIKINKYLLIIGLILVSLLYFWTVLTLGTPFIF